MSNASTLVTPRLTLRWMVQHNLPHVLQIERQVDALQWRQQDFLDVFQSGDTAGWVAEMNGHVVGFLIYKAITHPEIADPDLSSPLPFSVPVRENPVLKPLQISILNLAVALAWQRRGIGRALVEKLAQKLRQPGDCIQVSVPETHLHLQLLLREAGFKAMKVLRGYCGDVDAYLFKRQRD